MDQILNRPEFQSAVIPFLVALAVSAGLRKAVGGAWIWALFTAFLVSALLINGLTLTPLTGTRKIILLVLGAGIVAAIAPRLLRPARLQSIAAAGLTLLSVAWVFWAVVARKDTLGIALFAAGAIALVLSLAWSLERTRNSEARLHAAGFTLLLGTGLCAMAGASALLGQLALALAAASGGLFLTWVLTGKAIGAGKAGGPLLILPYLLPAAMIGLAASLFARLPWYALIPLATIPLAVSLVPLRPESRFLKALVYTLPGLAVALGTAFWVWQAGSSGSSGY
jgi:hypothetical protein